MRSILRPFVVALLCLSACSRAPARDPNADLHPFVRTGLRLALDGDKVVTATWLTRGGSAPVNQTIVAQTSKGLGSAVQTIAVVDGKVRAMAVASGGDIALTRVTLPKLVVLPRAGGAERVVSTLGDLKSPHAKQYSGVAMANGEIVFGVDNGYETYDDEDSGGIVWNPSVFRVPFGGGKVQDFSDKLGIADLVVDGADVFATFCIVAIDYPKDAGIVRIPLAGGEAKLLAAEQVVDGACPGGLAVDAHDVYFTVHDGLRRAPRDGGKTEPLIKVVGASAVAVDAGFAYVAGAREIVAMSKSSLAPRTLAQTDNAVSIAVDELHAYWMLEREGYVRRVVKPQGE